MIIEYIDFKSKIKVFNLIKSIKTIYILYEEKINTLIYLWDELKNYFSL